jgi:hypothetical protein
MYLNISGMHHSNLAHIHTLHHVQVEPKLEVHEEQVPEVFEGPQVSSVMDTNIFSDQGKLRCIPPTFLIFSFESLSL